MPDYCRSCRTPWTGHLGPEGTCLKLQRALSALRVIRTWASFEQDWEYPAFDRRDVLNLVERTLEKIEDSYKPTV